MSDNGNVVPIGVARAKHSATQAIELAKASINVAKNKLRGPIKDPGERINAVETFIDDRISTGHDPRVEDNYAFGLAAIEARMPWVPTGIDVTDRKLVEEVGIISWMWLVGFTYDMQNGRDYKKNLANDDTSQTRGEPPITPRPFQIEQRPYAQFALILDILELPERASRMGDPKFATKARNVREIVKGLLTDGALVAWLESKPGYQLQVKKHFGETPAQEQPVSPVRSNHPAAAAVKRVELPFS